MPSLWSCGLGEFLKEGLERFCGELMVLEVYTYGSFSAGN